MNALAKLTNGYISDPREADPPPAPPVIVGATVEAPPAPPSGSAQIITNTGVRR